MTTSNTTRQETTSNTTSSGIAKLV